MVISREYRIFREEELEAKKARTVYEKLARFFGDILKIEPDRITRKRLEEAIGFCHLRVSPRDVASITIFITFITCFPTFLLLITYNLFGFGIDLGLALFIFLMSAVIAYTIYFYPIHLKKRYEMNVGNDMVTAIIYMAIYLRNIPNLENACEFASRNIVSPLGFELRKLMWDVKIGNYLTIQDALLDYAKKWQMNKEFAEAIELLINSLRQTEARRKAILNEAVRIVLEGNRDSARHYVQGLRMPMMIIHAIGILLPIMGLVLFPIIAIFLKVSSIVLFILYNVALPFILFFVVSRTLETRPATYSRIDISEHPNLPPEGKFFLGKMLIPALPIAAICSITIIILGILMYSGEGILSAMMITLGIIIGPAMYYTLVTIKKTELRKKTMEIEMEFREALFQLGHSIGGGTPIELAMEESAKRMGEMKIKDLFMRASHNMRRLGMTFDQAFFDKNYGAILYYPSRLIKTIMRTVSEAVKKGTKAASAAMISVSTHVKGLHRTQEEVRETLSEVVSSLKFQAYFLSPMISGVICTMAIIMIRILAELSARTAALGGTGGTVFGIVNLANVVVTPFEFILVISIYVIQSCFLLAYLINGIESGEDKIGQEKLTANILISAFIVYAIAVGISLMIFSPLTTVVL